MSTHGLWGFIKNGDYIAKRSYSDSYPSYLGVRFLKACKSGDFSEFEINDDENYIRFIKDSLFCEWAYFYDFDKHQFEVWKGFQKEPDKNNPFGQMPEETWQGSGEFFYPCKLIYRDKVENIPLSIFEDNNNFLKIIERDKKINDIIGESRS